MKVCCIVGEGRSGSTLLARILGQFPGFLDIGELNALARALNLPGWRCGCGDLFDDCSFWDAVFGSDASFRNSFRVDDHGKPVAPARLRLRQIHRLWRASHGRPSPYGRAISAVYDAVSKIEAGAVLVDSSKSPSHALDIKGVETVDLYVVHLLRDARAVAYSQSRTRPHGGGIPNESMMKAGWPRAALRWNKNNHASALWVRAAVGEERYLRLTYEELVLHPQLVVKRVCSFLGQESEYWPFTSERTVHLEPTHNISGNPGRFKTGTVQICPDDEWKTAMTAIHKMGVSTLAGPIQWWAPSTSELQSGEGPPW